MSVNIKKGGLIIQTTLFAGVVEARQCPVYDAPRLINTTPG